MIKSLVLRKRKKINIKEKNTNLGRNYLWTSTTSPTIVTYNFSEEVYDSLRQLSNIRTMLGMKGFVHSTSFWLG